MKNKKDLGLKLGVIAVLLVMAMTVGLFYKRYDKGIYKNSLYTLAYNTSEFVYLSDINYIEEDSYVEPGYYLRKDKNSSSGLITVNIEGEKKPFIKGLSAWATSNLVYDVSSYDYDYFTAYLGVDAKETSTYYNSGVTFTIYTSNDGKEWTEAYKSGVKKGWDDAEFVKIPLKDVKYLKLYAYENGDSWYSMWYDDAVYADAKLIKEGYQERNIEDNTIVKKLSTYDEEIEKYDEAIKNGDFSQLDEYKLTLLQREFVSNVGYDNLQALLNYSDTYDAVLAWLMNDYKTLELYVLGGKPDGNYVTSLNILNDLYFKYKDTDLKNENKTEKGTVLKDLYKEMMVTLSLTHSANVGLWVSGAPENPLDPNGSSAEVRYEIFKKLHHNGLLINDIFEDLTVEEMRFVMNNIIDDEEIIWLNNYTTQNNSKNPYTYITYRFGYDYTNSKYYDESLKDEWNSKKRGNLPYAYNFNEYGITYKAGYPKLWIVFEEGSVCGGLSKTGSNIWGSYGVPSSVVSQPGHAAYIYISLDEKGRKVWNLANDVSGWGQSGKTEKLSVRMPNGWGDGDYAGTYPASYVVLATAALADYGNYEKAEEILMLANVYKNDYITLEKIYREAIKVQSINFSAWLGLVKNYENLEKTEEEYYALAEEVTNNLGNYPLPMHDLLKLIGNHLTSPNYKAKWLKLVETALTKATESNPDLVNDNVKKQVANYLLNANKDAVATFSFDGDNAGKIVLSKAFEGNEVAWQYNLKSSLSESDWHNAEGLSHTLTEEELNLIHEETDILIRIVGALDTVYDIPIEKAMMNEKLAMNDYENKFVGFDDTMEWQYVGDSTWIKFREKEPELSGNVEINVRVGRNKNLTPSEAETFTFTDLGEKDEQKYIPISRLSVHSVSSEELNRENDAKEHAIDGNINTMWHTLWDGSDQEKYIVLALDKPAYINALEYVPRQSSRNGIVLKADVLVSMDGINWDVAVSNVEWDNNNLSKIVNFTNVHEALYVKLVGVETYGDYMSAAMINLFEDATRNIPPTAKVEYSTEELTNQDVTVKLVSPSEKITLKNNDGKDTYTFTDNGEFTFEFVDEDGNKGSVTAKVTWIDKVPPKGEVKYSTTSDTTGNVEAEIIPLEDATVVGVSKYTFTKNGEYTFTIKDMAGNTSEIVAKVTWINEEVTNNDNNSNNSDTNDTNTNNSSNPSDNRESNNSNIQDDNNNDESITNSPSLEEDNSDNDDNNYFENDNNVEDNHYENNNSSENTTFETNEVEENNSLNGTTLIETILIVLSVLIVSLGVIYFVIRIKNKLN